MKPHPIALTLATALAAVAVFAEEPQAPAPPTPPQAPATPAPPGTPPQQLAPPPAPPFDVNPPERPAGPRPPRRDPRSGYRPEDERRGAPARPPTGDPERGPSTRPGDGPEDRGPALEPPGGRRRDDRQAGPRREEDAPPPFMRHEQHGPRPFLGVITADLPVEMSTQLGLPEGFGLLVREVVPDSPAASAGVEKYDVLTAIDDQHLVSPDQLAKLVRSLGKDKTASLTIIRKGKEQHLSAKLAEREGPDSGGPFDEMRRLFGPRVEGGYGDDIRESVRKLGEKASEWNFRARDAAGDVEDKARHAADEAQRAQRRVEEQLKQSLPNGRGPDVPPGDLLREARPGGGSRIERYNQNGVTTVDGAKAHLTLKDNDGEIEVAAENGHRVLTARNPKGDVVFTGPVDTEEQRKIVPEQFRKKLDAIKILEANGSSASAGVETPPR